MNDTTEIPVAARSTQGIVKIGNTVHRPVRENSPFVHSLLQLLEEKEFAYAPRFLGMDEKGREILTFVEGIVPHGVMSLSEAQIIQAVKILREFQDLTAGSPLAGEKEVCHHDYAHWNIIINNDTVVSVIDFDDAGPGDRLEDLGYFLWTFSELGSDEPVAVQAEKVKKVCDAYGLADRQGLVEAILDQQKKILAKRRWLAEHDRTQEARDFSKAKVPQIQAEIAWVKKHRDDLLF